MVTTYKYWVTMTDKFMSGWGKAQGKTNKLVFTARDYDEAKVVADNARRRGDMNYINICHAKPSYDPRRYYVQYKNKHSYPAWYRKGNW
jgi:hypothetical protein